MRGEENKEYGFKRKASILLRKPSAPSSGISLAIAKCNATREILYMKEQTMLKNNKSKQFSKKEFTEGINIFV